MAMATVFEDMLAERRQTNDFRWATKTWNPSGYFVRGRQKTPKEIIASVLSSKSVQDAIREISKKEGKSEQDLQKQAHDILVEMAHDYHLYAVRWFAIMLSKISKRLFISMQVNTSKIDEIRQAFLSYPVVILPTHRSYVDFLLVSYTFFHYNLPLPVIAAGMDFMGMAGIGEMLRRSGAFFIRRRFGGDTLYWALIKEYVKTCALKGGHPLEMFVEGTRSRSGKTISPKIGLLSAILELVWNAEVPDILILPISMSYDRTLEESLYAHELLGQPKPKESTNGLVKALRWLSSQCYGSIYMNFGNLISVRELVDQVRPHPLPLNGEFTQMVQQVAIKSVLEHQRHILVPIFPVVAVIILAEVSRDGSELSFEHVMIRVHEMQRILASRKNMIGCPHPDKSMEENVHLILHVHSSLVKFHSLSRTITPVMSPSEPVQMMQFQHYANQLLPLILPCCITSIIFLRNTNQREKLADFFKKSDHAELQDSFSDYIFYRTLLQEDFPYQKGAERMEFMWALASLQETFETTWASEKSAQSDADTASNTEQPTELLEVLSRGIEPYLIAYWGMTKVMLELPGGAVGPVPFKELSKICQNFIHEAMKISPDLPKQYGALSLDTLTNAILSSVQSLKTSKVKLADGSFGIVVRDKDQLRSALARLENILKINSSALSVHLSLNPSKSGEPDRSPSQGGKAEDDSSAEKNTADSEGNEGKSTKLMRSKL